MSQHQHIYNTIKVHKEIIKQLYIMNKSESCVQKTAKSRKGA